MSLGARMPKGFDLNLKFHKSIYFTIAARSYLAALLGTAVQWLEQSCKKYQGKVVFKKLVSAAAGWSFLQDLESPK